MDLVLDKGAQQNTAEGRQLTSDDLYAVPRRMQAHRLVQVLQEELERRNHQPPSSESAGLRGGGQRRLVHALWKIAAPTFVPAGVCEGVVVLCLTAMPLLVWELLAVLEGNPGGNVLKEGLPLAISLFAVSVINGFANHRHRHLAMKTGVAMRAAVVCLLYQHILQLSPEGKRGLTSGEITNLVSVDTQKLYEVTQEGHLIWALPLSIFLVSFFLYRVLGPSTLVGIAVLIAFVPIIQKVTHKMLVIRQKRIAYTDERVDIISTMLQGIKVTKLNNYEAHYLARVTAVRNKELKHLGREMAIWATTLLMTVMSPGLATGACFATYVLSDGSHTLTAADTFGVLLLFSVSFV